MITETIVFLTRKLVNEIKDVFFVLSRARDDFKMFSFFAQYLLTRRFQHRSSHYRLFLICTQNFFLT